MLWTVAINDASRGADLVSAIGNKQLSFLDDDMEEERMIRLESTIDRLRERFGHFSVQRALLLKDKPLTDLDPKNDHVIYSGCTGLHLPAIGEKQPLYSIRR